MKDEIKEELLYIKSRLELLSTQLRQTQDRKERELLLFNINLLEQRYEELKLKLEKVEKTK